MNAMRNLDSKSVRLRRIDIIRNQSISIMDRSKGDDNNLRGPFVVLDIGTNRKLFISKWFGTRTEKSEDRDNTLTIKNFEHKISINVNGPRIDQRTLPSAEEGHALAHLHSTKDRLDLMFRRWTDLDIHSSFHDYSLETLCKQNDNMDKTATLARRYGSDVCSTIMMNLLLDYDKHSQEEEYYSNFIDEKKDDGILNSIDGSNTVDDMFGRDIGMLLTYPLACAMAYAIQGRSSAVQGIINSLDKFIDAYIETLLEYAGQDNQIVCTGYLHGIGWAGWFLYMTYYRMTSYTHVLPFKGVHVEDQVITLDTIGMVGLKMMHLGFNDEQQKENIMNTPNDEMMSNLTRHRKAMEEILNETLFTLLDVHIVNHVHTKRRGQVLQRSPRIKNTPCTNNLKTPNIVEASLTLLRLGLWWL